MRSFLQRWFEATVSALVYSLVNEVSCSPADAKLHVTPNPTVRFVLAEHRRMTDYLRLPIAALTVAFDVAGLLFHRKTPQRRAGQIKVWRESSISPCRNLIRFYENLTMLGRVGLKSETVEVTPHVVSARANRGEVIVIGSGPGGAITACLLAEAGKQVILLEEGPHLPLESCEPFSIQEVVQKYRNGGVTAALGANPIAYAEGRCVGGGSEINSGLYHRTPPDMLERWRREFEVEGLDESFLLPLFEAGERDLSVTAHAGPLPPISRMLGDGARARGWKSSEVPRWINNGTRQSMTKTYIPRAIAAGCTLQAETRVRNMHRSSGTWHLEATGPGGVAVSFDAESVFVCGGAIHSAALLRRSELSVNAGRNLQMHPTVKVVAEFAEPINEEHSGVAAHQVKEFSPLFSFGCSISTPPFLSVALADSPREGLDLDRRWKHMAIYYAMIVPEGRGRVTPIAGFNDPVVRYALTLTDRRNLARALRVLCENLFAGGAIRVFPCTRPAQWLTSSELSKLPEILDNGQSGLMTVHLTSSCAMGERRDVATVDSFGRVFGQNHLYVSDAGILCTAPGVNPQGTIMALARRNALRYLGKI